MRSEFSPGYVRFCCRCRSVCTARISRGFPASRRAQCSKSLTSLLAELSDGSQLGDFDTSRKMIGEIDLGRVLLLVRNLRTNVAGLKRMDREWFLNPPARSELMTR